MTYGFESHLKHHYYEVKMKQYKKFTKEQL